MSTSTHRQVVEAAADFDRAAGILYGAGMPLAYLTDLDEEAAYLRASDGLFELESHGQRSRYLAASRESRRTALLRIAQCSPHNMPAAVARAVTAIEGGAS